MIILDTNVVSELSRSHTSPEVLRWFDEQPLQLMHFTSIGLAEVLSGLAIMPAGRRKAALERSLKSLMDKLFGGRILPFDEAAATAFADIVALAQRKGKPLPLADAMIAAIAKVHGFAVATRDTAPFAAAGIDVINPWAL